MAENFPAIFWLDGASVVPSQGPQERAEDPVGNPVGSRQKDKIRVRLTVVVPDTAHNYT